MKSFESLKALRSAIASVLSDLRSKSNRRETRQRCLSERLESRQMLNAEWIYIDEQNSSIPEEMWEGQYNSITVQFGCDTPSPNYASLIADGINTPSYGWSLSNSWSVFHDDSGATVTLDLEEDWGWTFGNVWHQEWLVQNVQPTATLSYDPGDGGEDYTLSLLDPVDPSSVDTTHGFRYSAAGLYGDLAETYGEASTDHSFIFDDEDADGVIWTRIFDKDGGYSDYNTSYVLPTVNLGTVSASSVALSWNDVATGETGWYVQRAPFGGTFATIATLGANVSSYTDDTVDYGTRYQYRVRAFGTPGTAGDTAYSAKRAVTTPSVSISNLTATPGATSGTATLNWQDNLGNETGFSVLQRENGGAFVEVASLSANTTTFELTNLKAWSSYEYQIVAERPFGYSVESIITPLRSSAVRPLSVQAETVAGSSTPHQMTLTFSQDIGTTLSASDIVIESLSDGSTYNISVENYNATTKTATLSFNGGVLPESVYQLRLLKGSVHSATNSLTSEFDFTFYVMPGDANGDGRVNVADRSILQSNWNQSGKHYSDGDFDRSGTVDDEDLDILNENWFRSIVRTFNAYGTSTTSIHLAWESEYKSSGEFHVLRSNDGGATFETIATHIHRLNRDFDDTNLQPGKSYLYRVVYVEGYFGGPVYGEATNVQQASTMLPTPALVDVDVDPLDPRNAVLDFDAELGTIPEDDIRVVIINSMDGGALTEIAAWDLADLPELGFVEGTHNLLRIYMDRGDSRSDLSSQFAYDAPAYAPDVPEVSSITTTSAIFSWYDQSAHETGYQVRVLNKNGVEVKNLSLPAGSEQTTITGLTEGVEYTFLVRANSAGGWSTVAETYAVTEVQAPTDLATSAPTTSSIGLAWQCASGNETGYEIRVLDEAGVVVQTLTTAANVLQKSITGLSDGVNYTFSVRTKCPDGWSTATQIAAATKLIPPTALGAFAPSPYDINLSWQHASSNESWLEIEYDDDEATLAANAKGTTISGLANDTEYTFTLTAHNDYSQSDPVEITWSTAALDESSGGPGNSTGYTTIRTLVPGSVTNLERWFVSGLEYTGSYSTLVIESHLRIEDGWVPIGYIHDDVRAAMNRVGGNISVILDGVPYTSGPIDTDPDFNIAIHDETKPQGADITWNGFHFTVCHNTLSYTGPDHYEDIPYIDPGSPDPEDPSYPANNVPEVSIEATDNEGAEVGDDTITFTVSRTGDTSKPLTVLLQTPSGTATNGQDYTGWPGTSITIPTGEESWEITLIPANDNLIELPEVVAVELKANSIYTMGSGSADATIQSGEDNPDLDIDSDNNNGVNAPDRNATEDEKEDTHGENGKIVPVNDDDTDNDTIPDFADFNGISGEQFVPIVIELPAGANPSQVFFELRYDDSPPSQFTHTHIGTPQENWDVAPGSLRIWVRSGSQTRNPATVGASGHFWESGGRYRASDIGFTSTTRSKTFWVEAVRASKSIADLRIQLLIGSLGSGPIKQDAIRLTSLRTRDSWHRQALKNAGINPVMWVPANGFPANDQIVRSVYTYYRKLFNALPNKFLWAGLARLAGGAVYSGLQFERWVINRDPEDQMVALKEQEKIMLTMQRDIFFDLAWQHEAYKDTGLFALELIQNADTTILPGDIATNAWKHIDSANPLIVNVGNQELLRREQELILQPLYDQISSIEGHALSYFTLSPIPGGGTFLNIMGSTANVAVFVDRWAWIITDMVPIWEGAAAATRAAWVNSPLTSLVHN